VFAIQLAEAERVKNGHGSGAHGEDVPQDSAHTCSGSVVGSHKGRMVVAFDLEDNSFPATDIHYSSSFTGALEHSFPFGGESLQDGFGVFVAAVLGPEDGEESSFGEVGQAAELLYDLGVFFIC
jgi:hypothetical protein